MVRACALALSALIVLAGCTAATSGSVAQNPQTAPPVSNPKDAQGFAPCSLLTAAQATDLGLDPTRAKAGATADLVDCRWLSVQPPVSGVAVALDTNPTRRGLTDIYLKRDTFPIFEPLVVDSYPAVRAEVGPSNDCSIDVGLSDTQDVLVIAFARSPTDSCGLVKRVIAAMLTNLPPQR